MSYTDRVSAGDNIGKQTWKIVDNKVAKTGDLLGDTLSQLTLGVDCLVYWLLMEVSASVSSSMSV